MNQGDLQQYLDFAKGLAGEAGKIMLRYFRADDIGTQWKEDNSPITIADQTINDLVIKRVKESFPDHGVIGEEGSFEEQRIAVWVVDPIDGTALFDLGIPSSTFCLALVVDGEVQVSVVLDPYKDSRLYTAVRGRGATKNGKQLLIDKHSKQAEHYMFIPGGTKEAPTIYESAISTLRKQGVRISFIPTFTYLSTLVLDSKASVSLMGYGSPWDSAAISLLIEEAGGKATDLSGKTRKYNEWGNGIILSNGVVHEKILGLINNADTRN